MKTALFIGLLHSALLWGVDRGGCPWMNSATAAGILDGPVEMRAASPTACEFVRQKPPVYRLQIRVEDQANALEKCLSHPTPLKGIGNEAFACVETGGEGQRIERIAGKVRDQVFEIRVITGDSSVSGDWLLERARRAAEQVTGNLF